MVTRLTHFADKIISAWKMIFGEPQKIVIAEFPWLQSFLFRQHMVVWHSRHTFSFGDYFDLYRMGFRSLRVINDDIVEVGEGFGAHPHRMRKFSATSSKVSCNTRTAWAM